MDIRERMMNSMILLKNGCVHNGRGQVSTTDLLIDGGKIVKIGEHLEASGADVIDAAGMHVFPGFIDPLSDWGILGPGREIRGNANDNDERSDVFTPQLEMCIRDSAGSITAATCSIIRSLPDYPPRWACRRTISASVRWS